MLVKSATTDSVRSSRTNKVSLSSYFPKGTTYFYGYPSGEESGFLNHVPPAIEELVAARPLVCAGDNMIIITFASTVRPEVSGLLHKRLGSPLHHIKKTQILPSHIDATVVGKERNEHIKRSLKELARPGSLVMAQPFLDEDLRHLYQISPRLTNWLNDKRHMGSYIPKELLPTRYATYKNGTGFYNTQNSIPLPCVVKVSSSSAGDGVYICPDTKSLAQVKAELRKTAGTIIVEEYINATANYGIQFGIPEDPELPIDIIGVNRQLTTTEGEFIGGIIDHRQEYSELNTLKQSLVSQILPEVRKLGWYGVGCFDVLTDNNGKCYIIDCNFRMTGMTAYLMLSANRQIARPLVSFSGEFKGTLVEFERLFAFLPQVEESIHVLALTEREGSCRFNAAILFDSYEDIPIMAQTLLAAGLVSKALEQLVQSS